MAKNGKGKAAAAAPITAEQLLARMDALENDNKSLRQTNTALMSQAPIVSSVAVAPKEVDLTGLPDPIADGPGYAAAVAKRISDHASAVISHATSTQTAKQTQKQKIDGLFADFSAKFPELAKDRDRLDFIAQKVVARAQASGMDAEKYMFMGKDQFFADVDAAYRKVFPVAVAEPVVTDEEPAIDNADPIAQANATALETDDDEEDGRTAGIFGGIESGGKQSAPARSKEEEAARKAKGIVPGDLIDDLQNAQRKSGFF